MTAAEGGRKTQERPICEQQLCKTGNIPECVLKLCLHNKPERRADHQTTASCLVLGPTARPKKQALLPGECSVHTPGRPALHLLRPFIYSQVKCLQINSHLSSQHCLRERACPLQDGEHVRLLHPALLLEVQKMPWSFSGWHMTP